MHLTLRKIILAATIVSSTAEFATTALSAAAQPGEAFADFSADGGWCWFADPRAVTREGKTYAGWVASDGSVQIGALNNAGGEIRIATLHAQFQRDDHDNPSLLFLPDGRLTAFYSKHAGPEMTARTTIRPGDISEWTPERTLEVARPDRARKNFTYPTPVMLSAENNAIYLFWRGDNWKPTFSKSTDGGATWQPQKEIVRRAGANSDNRPYVKIASDNKSRIHIVFTDGHPRNEAQNSVYYCCYHDGAFFKADGTRITTVDQLPFEPRQADCIYDAAKTGVRAWVWDVAIDADGNPAIAYTRLPAETDHRYHYARWDGKSWFDRELTGAGKWFPETPAGQKEREPHYSGGVVLDHSDASVVYLSRPINGVFEIEKWSTPDRGATWKTEPITAGSKFNNVRPFVVRGHDASGPTVLWLNTRGGYVHYTDYRAAIKTDRPSRTMMLAAATLPPISAAFEPKAVLSTMERVADWQIANPGRHKSTNWTQAACYTGIMALDKISPSARFREAMLRMGESNRWQCGPRKYDADDYCIGQTYVELWQRYHDDKMLAPMKEQFDFIIANPREFPSLDFTQKNVRDLWSWCDSLFMGPPAWMRLHAATGDKRYLDFAVANWWRTSDYLYDTNEHLYFRDSTYFTKREANGKKIFWSRGNGWVMGGLARVIPLLPKNHPSRPRFEQQFKEMAAKILECQQSDGLWRASLLDPDSYPLKETSGSGFYTFALAWGVNEGLLDRAKFEPAVRRAWTALVACVTPEGKLTHVQPIGADPKKFDQNATEVYGVGAFLLAGSEVYRMAGK